jgi:hypothetical protein
MSFACKRMRLQDDDDDDSVRLVERNMVLWVDIQKWESLTQKSMNVNANKNKIV